MNDLINYLIPTWDKIISQPLGYLLAEVFICLYIAAWLLLWLFKSTSMWLYARGLKSKNIHLLMEEISDIEVKYNSSHDFSFLVEDLEGSSIESRDTFIENDPNKKAFLNRQILKLQNYYAEIKKEIDVRNIPEKVLSKKDIDFIINKVFTKERIYSAVEKLNDKRKKNDTRIAFIGNKLGLYDYSYSTSPFSKPKLLWTCYRSDHFTWLVFKELCSDRAVPKNEEYSPYKFFDNLCKRLEKYQKNDAYRTILMHTLCYLFSSLGIDALVVGKDYKNRKVCLASVRSANIDRSYASRIHVSVDEAFSDTDSEQEESYSVKCWVKRGIEEEIGILQKDLDNIKISYTDFSIVFGNYGEIGLSAIIDAENLDTWLVHPGKDKALESAGMFFIEIPSAFSLLKMLLSPKRGLQMYIGRKIDKHYAKLSWVEFAVPIYIRTFLRKLSLPINWITAITIATFIPILASYFQNDTEIDFWSFVWQLGGFIFSLIITFLNYRYKRKYLRFISWTPLWNGNAKALQLTGRILTRPEGNVNNGLYMATENNININIKNIRIIEPPLCAIRKSYIHEELPISFYKVAASGRGKRLRFFSSYYNDNIYHTIYYYSIRLKDKNQARFRVGTYSFNFDVSNDINFRFNKTLDELSAGNNPARRIAPNSLKCYFGLHDLPLNKYSYCNELPNEIASRHQLCDLFEYKDSYYWSTLYRTAFPVNDKSKTWELAKKLLDRYIEDTIDEKTKRESYNELLEVDKCISTEKNAKHVASYQYKNKEEDIIQIDIFCIEDINIKSFEKKINSLLKRSIERFGGKINELETLALQYMLVRNNIYLADIRYNWFNVQHLTSIKKQIDDISNLSGIFIEKT